MKLFPLLIALGIALTNIVVQGQDDPVPGNGGAGLGTVKVRPIHSRGRDDQYDFDYWKPRMQPPFTESERREAIMEVGRLINAARSRPGWKQWMTDTIVPSMTQLLQDENAKIRAAAAGVFSSYIQELGKEALPILTQLLHDPDKSVRCAAATALGTMESAAEVSVPALIKVVHEDPSTAFTAAMSLQLLGSKGMGAFLSMFDDPDDRVRYAAVRSYVAQGKYRWSETQKAQAVPGLLKLLQDPSADVRAEAVVAIPPVKEAASQLIDLLHDPDARVRANAARFVSDFEKALPAVLSILNDENPRVRSNAKIKLAQIGSGIRPLPPEMLKLADDPDFLIRVNLAKNLGRSGRDAIPTLVRLLEDQSPGVRGTAATSLGEIGPIAKDAAPSLERHLTDRGRTTLHGNLALVCHTAAEALNRIVGGKDYRVGLPPMPPDGK